MQREKRDKDKPGWVYLKLRPDHPTSPLEKVKSAEWLPPCRNEELNLHASCSNEAQNKKDLQSFPNKADRDLQGYPLEDGDFEGWYWRPNSLVSPTKARVVVNTVTSRVLIHFNVLDTWTFEYLSGHVQRLSGPIISELVLISFFLPIEDDYDRMVEGAVEDLEMIYGKRRKVERKLSKKDPRVDAAVVKVVRDNIGYQAGLMTELLHWETKKPATTFCLKKQLNHTKK